MSLSPEQRSELIQFPDKLRELVESELAAGNRIIEIGHSFPAPPVGAFIKLANRVSTRPRDSTDGLVFYDRNSSLYSGEFTDAKRFHFVLEPPGPPPLPPDMDAIRNANAPKIAPAKPNLPAKRRGPKPSGNRQPAATKATQSPGSSNTAIPEPAPPVESRAGKSRTVFFQDKRPPHALQHQLERDLVTLFVPRREGQRLTLVGRASNVGCPYVFELRFEAALSETNLYSLHVEASWNPENTSNHEYYRDGFEGWFRLYTQDLQTTRLPSNIEDHPERYQSLVNETLQAEQHLDSIPRIQQAILDSMRRGASFRVSHREGGTRLLWQNGSFIRSDYGEEPGEHSFANEQEFLAFLRRYYDWETSKNVYPNKVPDLDAWKLINRLLYSPEPTPRRSDGM